MSLRKGEKVFLGVRPPSTPRPGMQRRRMTGFGRDTSEAELAGLTRSLARALV